MELSASKTGIKIKSKNYSFSLDSLGDSDDSAVLISRPDKAYEKDDKLFISGPGEYEVAGVSIKGEKTAGGIIYELINDSKRIFIFPSVESIKGKDTEGYDAVLIYIDQQVESSSLSDLASELVVIYGEKDKIKIDAASLRSVDKVNLKKTEDLKGFTIFLNKE